MRVRSFLCSDSLVYTSFFFFLFYMVFIHVVIVHAVREHSTVIAEEKNTAEWSSVKSLHANMDTVNNANTFRYMYMYIHI